MNIMNMGEITHNVALGLGAVFIAPFSSLPHPGWVLTMPPPEDPLVPIGMDFVVVSHDLCKGIEAAKTAKQLELKFEPK